MHLVIAHWRPHPPLAALKLVGLLLMFGTSAAVGASYYIDFAAGDDGNAGTDPTTAWQHCPGDPNATATAATRTPAPGDVLFFKKGVTYSGAITPKSGGTLVSTGALATVTASGVLTDAGANFAPVKTNDWVYIFNSLTNGAYHLSCGAWQVGSVSASSVQLVGFDRPAYATANMTWQAWRPITFTSTTNWGVGDAVISGGLTNYFGIRASRNYIVVEDLRFVDSYFPPAHGCNTQAVGALYDNSGTGQGLLCRDLSISNWWSGVYPAADFVIVQDCTVDNFGALGAVGGSYSLIEHNVFTNGMSGVRSGKYSIIRRNLIVGGGKTASAYCGNHGDGIGPLFSSSTDPGGNCYGWIYGNIIQGVVEGIFFEYNNLGSRGWTVCGNVLIGQAGVGGSGDRAIMVHSAPETRVYNNVITGVNGTRGWGLDLEIGDRDFWGLPSTNCEFENNLIYNGDSVVDGIKVYSHLTNTFSARSNRYYEPANSGNMFVVAFTNGSPAIVTNFAGWRAWGYDTGIGASFGLDPLFGNVNGTNYAQMDLRLRTNSPALSGACPCLTVPVVDNVGASFEAGGPRLEGAYAAPIGGQLFPGALQNLRVAQ